MTNLLPPTIKFDYSNVKSGFATFSIMMNGEVYALSPGYLHDTLGDIVRAGIFLCGGGMSATVQMDEETGTTTRVIFSWWGDVEISISDKTVFSQRVELETVIRAIIDMAETVLETYSDEEYRDLWVMHDLPRDDIRLLKDLMERRAF